jgi:hypothetical protein
MSTETLKLGLDLILNYRPKLDFHLQVSTWIS